MIGLDCRSCKVSFRGSQMRQTRPGYDPSYS
ncbi:hypothetical protein PMIN01_13484 [Paraphaeosphaeria minitans]|uniref:Uncharacterized protein n=1 Tax=Paraphaeosphaeria minitans TaxID=565426 RepID=A0A9P6G4S6_9PLEO|nr:hypothetical protein PMIN01_13484 [Paraphaeosphaeria minitans]